MKLYLALLLATALSTPVLAADLAPNPPEPSAPVIEPFSWTGFYVGAHIGGTETGGKLRGTSTSTDGGKSSNVSRSGFHSGLGLLGGVQAGYNYQINQLVLGVEADANFGSSRSSRTFNDSIGIDEFATTFIKERSDWSGSLRGRLGFAWDRWLPYLTAGVAVRDDKLSGGTVWPIPYFNPSTFGSGSKTQFGFIGGLGVEYALNDHWSVRAQGLYSWYPKHSVTFSSTGDYGTSTTTIRSTPQVFTFDLGVNYKF